MKSPAGLEPVRGRETGFVGEDIGEGGKTALNRVESVVVMSVEKDEGTTVMEVGTGEICR